MDILIDDVEVTVYGAGSAGSQSWAVKLTHRPTGMTATKRGTSSPGRLRQRAMQLLEDKLAGVES